MDIFSTSSTTGNHYAPSNMEQISMEKHSTRILNSFTMDNNPNEIWLGEVSAEPNKDSSSMETQSRRKKYKCPQCAVCCSNKGQLRGHIRTHTGERPFACSFEGCTRQFARNEELTRHTRIHSGVRPHKCNKCEKAFGRKDHLTKHEKTHLRHRRNNPSRRTIARQENQNEAR